MTQIRTGLTYVKATCLRRKMRSIEIRLTNIISFLFRGRAATRSAVHIKMHLPRRLPLAYGKVLIDDLFNCIYFPFRLKENIRKMHSMINHCQIDYCCRINNLFDPILSLINLSELTVFILKQIFPYFQRVEIY